MILPGDLLNQKIDSQIWFRPAFFLVALNVLIHLLVYMAEVPTYNLDADLQLIKKPANLKLMNSMYLQAQDPILKIHAETQTKSDPYLFVKDIQFWKKAQSMVFIGDQVQVEKNKNFLKHLDLAFENSTQQKYGLSPQTNSIFNWITYQFTHASFFHLFSNVIFMFLIASVLQNFISASWIMTVYLMSGVMAGVMYLIASDGFNLPLVGASGSVSGLIAFLCVIKAQENIKWTYLISPFKAGFGTLFLPAYLLFPIFLLADFTSVLVNVQGVSGVVAHSAHIGGALAGFVLGLSYRTFHCISFKFLTYLR